MYPELSSEGDRARAHIAEGAFLGMLVDWESSGGYVDRGEVELSAGTSASELFGMARPTTVTVELSSVEIDGLPRMERTDDATGPYSGFRVATTDSRKVLRWNGPLLAREVKDQLYTEGVGIAPLELPSADGGDLPLEYSLSGELPEGLKFSTLTRTLTGTPTKVHRESSYVWRVADASGRVHQSGFKIKVQSEVCRRTLEVRDAIVDAFMGVRVCDYVKAEHLASITVLDISSQGIVRLKEGDFGGLSGLRRLHLGGNELNSLPSGVFSELVSLEELHIDGNKLGGLPSGIFEGLVGLRELSLSGNELSDLSTDTFVGLSRLSSLRLHDNRLGGLLHDNRLADLPEGIFLGLELTDSLTLHGNGNDYFKFQVRPELSSEGDRVRAHIAQGAFLGMLVNWESSGGYVDRGEAELSAGASASEWFGMARPTTVTVELLSVKIDGLPLSERTDDATGPYSGFEVTATGRENLRWNGPLLMREVGDQSYTEEVGIDPLELPSADGGDAPLAYSLSGELPEGLKFSTLTRTLTGTPTEVHRESNYVWKVADASGREDRREFTIKVRSEVCARTPQVRDAIMEALMGVIPVCDYVKAEHLASITVLDISSKRIARLEEGDFAGLSGLRRLHLGGNELNSLPSGVFSELVSLEELHLDGNELGGLPSGIFGGLVGLRELSLSGNELQELEAGVFGGLNALGSLYLDNNELSGLRSDTFVGLSRLSSLRLHDNRLAGLPEGIFLGLELTDSLTLHGNTSEPIVFLVSPGLSAEGDRARANIAQGAFLGMLVNWVSSGGYVDGGEVELSAGTSASESFGMARPTTVTVELLSVKVDGLPLSERTDDATGPYSGFRVATTGSASLRWNGPLLMREVEDQSYTQGMEIRPLELPSGVGGDVPLGYSLSGELPEGLKFSTLTRTLTGTPTEVHRESNYVWKVADASGREDRREFTIKVRSEVCARTPQVRDAIVEELTVLVPGTRVCDYVKAEHLASITVLDISSKRIAQLEEGDFAGLSGLRRLHLGGNELNSLPSGVFSELVSLEELHLDGNELGGLPSGIFGGLGSLRELSLSGNKLRGLEAGVFGGLNALGSLYLDNNELSGLRSDTFVGLSRLSSLRLHDNRLAGLPEGIFLGLELTDSLTLHGNTSEPIVFLVSPGLSAEGDRARANIAQGAFLGMLVNWASSGGYVDGGEVELSAGTSASESFGMARPTTVTVELLSVKIDGLPLSERTDDATGPYSGFRVATTRSVSLRWNGPLLAREVEDQSYMEGVEIRPLELPSADGGDVPLGYSLSGELPEGLKFSTLTRTLTGTPTEVQRESDYIWEVVDASGRRHGSAFTIKVRSEVCTRTPQVRDAIVEALTVLVPGTRVCDYVKAEQLALIAALDISSQSIVRLQQGDFAGLSSLQSLNLSGNQLTRIRLGIFAGLADLRELDLSSNEIGRLEEDAFSGLGNLRKLLLDNNRISGMASMVFADLSNMTTLSLRGNRLSSLPENVFVGLSLKDLLDLSSNPGSPLKLSVRVESSNNGRARARIREGAPLTIEVLWLSSGDSSVPGAAYIRDGTIASEVFGMPHPRESMTITLIDAKSADVVEQLDDAEGSYRGFRLATTGSVTLPCTDLWFRSSGVTAGFSAGRSRRRSRIQVAGGEKLPTAADLYAVAEIADGFDVQFGHACDFRYSERGVAGGDLHADGDGRGWRRGDAAIQPCRESERLRQGQRRPYRGGQSGAAECDTLGSGRRRQQSDRRECIRRGVPGRGGRDGLSGRGWLCRL